MKPGSAYKRSVASHALLLATSTWRPALAVARWVLLRGARHPALSVLGLLLALLVPLQAQLSPLADVGLDPAWSLAGAWIVPVGILGAALALGVLGQGVAFLELLPPHSRLAGEGLAVLAAAAGLQLPLVVGAAWVAQGGPGSGPWVWLAADLQVSAVALLVLRWKVATSLRVGVFAGLLWVLPAMLPAGGRLADGLRLLTDVGRPPSNLADGIARGLAVLGLVLASVLLVSRHASAAPHVAPR